MREWAARWMPWATVAEVKEMECQAARRRSAMTADGVARLLYVSHAERERLGLKTIGACDVAKQQRLQMVADKKRERDRKRAAEKRKAAGAKSRNSYQCQSLSRSKPWEAEGMSRRTWYRRQNGTGP